MTSVAAVIPNWNTAGYLERCLAALEHQDGVQIETLVVDNGSDDASLALLERNNVPHVALASNIGFAAAVNLGVARTRAPFILVLNADCFLDPDSLVPLVTELEGNERLGGVQPRIVQEDAAGPAMTIYSAGQCLTRNGAAYERGWGHADTPAYAIRREVFGVSGAACLLRRELFAALGGYDASYFAFYEDVDLNARARLSGWGFAYCPAARAVHVGHAGWRQGRRSESFNVELTVRNRLATAIKVLPASGVLGATGLTVRSLVAGPFRGTGIAAAKGGFTALVWVPRLLRERRQLRGRFADRLDVWLARTAGRGPDPRSL